MTPGEFAQLRALFDEVMDLPPAERRAHAESHAPQEPLRTPFLKMVAAAEESGFLTTSALPRFVQPLADELPLLIGNYSILRQLQRGGMGVVYLAFRSDDAFHKIVALKVIGSVPDATNEEFVARFKRERQILAGLEHANIARLLDGGSTDDGRPFFVMEYVAGTPIDEYCRNTETDVTGCVKMVLQLCDAAGHLHKHAIAHRDIKPNNVLVTRDGRVKLVDFGIAKVETLEGLVPSLAGAGQATMIMTPGYASPEQLAGDGGGKSSDIYSIGVVLYQLMTGRLPFVGHDGRPDLNAQLVGRAPAPPSKMTAPGHRTAPRTGEAKRASRADLDLVVLTALRRDPANRYGSVDALADDLRRCLDGRPITARPESAVYRFHKLLGRNRIAAALVLMLIVLIGTVAWMTIGMRIERARNEGKKTAFADVVGKLETLISRIDQWGKDGRVTPLQQRIADVQQLRQIVSSGALPALVGKTSEEGGKRVVEDLARAIQRAEEQSAGEPTLRKEVAVAYREIGDFQSKAPQTEGFGRKQAEESYQRAARVARSLKDVDENWVAAELAEIDSRVQQFGARLEMADSGPSSAPQSDPRAPRPPPGKGEVTTPRIPPYIPVDLEKKATLLNALALERPKVERVRRNMEDLIANLLKQGKDPRSDLRELMSKIDAAINEATTSLDASDLGAADAAIRAARAHRANLEGIVGRGGS